VNIEKCQEMRFGCHLYNMSRSVGTLGEEDCACTKGRVTMCMKTFWIKSESTQADAGVYFPRTMKWGGNVL